MSPDLLHASERMNFMLRASIRLVCSAIGRLFQNRRIRPFCKNSNNPLAGKPETENDTGRGFSCVN
jgi:hypothetical protein